MPPQNKEVNKEPAEEKESLPRQYDTANQTITEEEVADLMDSFVPAELAAIDKFTRYVETWATSNIRAKTIANGLVEQWACRHGTPTAGSSLVETKGWPRNGLFLFECRNGQRRLCTLETTRFSVGHCGVSLGIGMERFGDEEGRR